jgi:hypothetical protein
MKQTSEKAINRKKLASDTPLAPLVFAILHFAYGLG